MRPCPILGATAWARSLPLTMEGPWGVNAVPNPVCVGGPGIGPGQQSPNSQIGQADDSFVVYKGGDEKPLETPPAWRYVAMDGLSPHSVPAVAVFRKAVENAEKAAAAKKP